MTAPTLATQSPVADILAMIQVIAPDTRRLLNGVTWEEYKQVSAALPDSAKVRLAYHEGMLEIVTYDITHEHYKESLLRLVSMIADAMEIDLESIGSTTLTREQAKSAAEPDTAFYVTHAQSMIGCKAMDLEKNPPPDIVVEVDITNSSWNKRALYAKFGVPELWHLVLTNLTIYALHDGGYQPRVTSQMFPFLTAQALTQFLEECETEGQAKALRNFRKQFISFLRPAQ